MKKFTFLVGALAALVMAAPASASVQSVKISGAINNIYLYRQGFDLGDGSDNTEKQSLLLTQTTLNVEADLTDQVSATVGLINERFWSNDVSANDGDLSIYLAYVTLREMLYSPLTLIVGRQQFSYGNGLIFDSTGPNTAAPSDSALNGIAGDLTLQYSLDAIRAIFDYNPLTLELVYAVVNYGSTTITDNDDLDTTLYGANATYALGDDLDSVIESYFWWQENKSTATAVGSKGTNDVVKVAGIRASTNPIEGLNIQAEYAFQGGTKVTGGDTYQRQAHAFQGIVNYQLPILEEYNPVTQYVFTKVTGNNDNGETEQNYTAWDPFFEAQGGGTIYNTMFSLSDLIIHSVSIQMEPMEDVTTKLSLHGLWREKESKGTSDTLNSPDSTTNALAIEDNESWLGKELDFDVSYAYTEDVEIGASLGYFFPGTYFAEDNSDVAKQVLVNMNVAF